VRLLIRGKHRHATLRPARKWGDGIYESDFLKENGVWKIQHEHSFFIYYVRAASGWDQGGDPPSGPPKGYHLRYWTPASRAARRRHDHDTVHSSRRGADPVFQEPALDILS
jgi:hypothetical protein